MSEANSLENCRCVDSRIKPSAIKKHTNTVSLIEHINGEGGLQINGHDNYMEPRIEDEEVDNCGETKNHVQTVTISYNRNVNGTVCNGSANKDVKDITRKKRRSQSDNSDGSPRSKSLQESDVGFMWTQTNGYTVPDSSPLSPDVFYSAAQVAERQEDDMNGYVSANAHMLAYLDLNGENHHSANGENHNFVANNVDHVAPNANVDEHEEESMYDKIDEGIALASELELIPPQTKLSTSSEDQGDFIETDIPSQQTGFSSYGNSRDSSYDDLPNLVQASVRELHNNNISTDCPTNKSRSCESCDRNQAGVAFTVNTCGESGKTVYDVTPCNENQDRNTAVSLGLCNNISQTADQESPRWHNNGQHLPTNRSSTSSFLSPDMDIEFMDFDIELGIVNSESQNEFNNEAVWQVDSIDSSNDVEEKKYGDNGDNIDSSSCCACDKISDKFNNHSSHFKSCCRSKSNPLISCCRNHHLKGQNENKLCTQECNIRKAGVCRICGERSTLKIGDREQEALSGDMDYTNNLEVKGAVGLPPSEQSGILSNNLDSVFSCEWNLSDIEDERCNVSRQTSTSNFDQDENSFQDDCDESSLNKEEQGAHNNKKEDHGCDQPANSDYSSDNEQFAHSIPLYNGVIDKEGRAKADDVEADDELEDEGTPPPIPDTRPPLNRRLELLQAHNQNIEQNLLSSASTVNPSPSSENQVLAGAVGGADFKPGATNFGDDESPNRALHLLEYQFLSDDIDFNSRRQVPQSKWMTSVDGDCPLRSMRLLEHDFINPASSFTEAKLPNGEDSCDSVSRNVIGLNIATADSLTDIFVANLLRKKPISRRGRLLVTSENDNHMEKVMIWSEYEAYVLQVKQIGVSACGATAVINVLKAFDIYPDKTVVCKAVKTNLRAEMSSVPEYLLSRSIAGTTAHHLIEGIDELTNGEVCGRFFHFWPPRQVELRKWLTEWMKKGAVPVVTLNLQKGVPNDIQIPDAWHHQMVYGVGPKGIYLTNPLDIVPEAAIIDQLSSDSVLLVRRSDIILRWTNSANLGILLNHADIRWRTLNVVGQVVNVMRESVRPRIPGFRPQQTSHVQIPAFYKAGVTLFVKKDSPVCNELLQAPELPLQEVITSVDMAVHKTTADVEQLADKTGAQCSNEES